MINYKQREEEKKKMFICTFGMIFVNHFLRLEEKKRINKFKDKELLSINSFDRQKIFVSINSPVCAGRKTKRKSIWDFFN